VTHADRNAKNNTAFALTLPRARRYAGGLLILKMRSRRPPSPFSLEHACPTARGFQVPQVADFKNSIADRCGLEYLDRAMPSKVGRRPPEISDIQRVNRMCLPAIVIAAALMAVSVAWNLLSIWPRFANLDVETWNA
jgi:hypothetical protein